MKKIKALWSRVPAPVRASAVNVAKHFGTAFTGTFVVLVEGVWRAPDFHTAKALFIAAVVAATVAGVRAAFPLSKALAIAVAKAIISAAGPTVAAETGVTFTPGELDHIIALLASHPEVVAELRKKMAAA